MAKNQGISGKSLCQVYAMKAGQWFALCLCCLFLGGVAGWSLRVHTADHRYVRALAEQHEASATYYQTKLDQMVKENKETYRGKK